MRGRLRNRSQVKYKAGVNDTEKGKSDLVASRREAHLSRETAEKGIEVERRPG